MSINWWRIVPYRGRGEHENGHLLKLLGLDSLFLHWFPWLDRILPYFTRRER